MSEATIDTLREYLPKGSTVYLVLRHVSRSGMSRRISPIAIDHGNVRHIGWLVADLMGYGTKPGGHPNDDGLRVDGAGMDMGFHLVYELSRVLHGDGYALKHQWL